MPCPVAVDPQVRPAASLHDGGLPSGPRGGVLTAITFLFQREDRNQQRRLRHWKWVRRRHREAERCCFLFVHARVFSLATVAVRWTESRKQDFLFLCIVTFKLVNFKVPYFANATSPALHQHGAAAVTLFFASFVDKLCAFPDVTKDLRLALT